MATKKNLEDLMYSRKRLMELRKNNAKAAREAEAKIKLGIKEILKSLKHASGGEKQPLKAGLKQAETLMKEFKQKMSQLDSAIANDLKEIDSQIKSLKGRGK